MVSYSATIDIPPVTVDLNVSYRTERTQRRYISAACEVITAVLQTLSPSSPGELWMAVRDSGRLSEAFDCSEKVGLSRSEESIVYLNALAESYINATSSNIKKQVLSIIADLATLKEIRHFIPGLTKYMFCEARRHRLQYGRGVPLLSKSSPRVRYDVTMLEHFLDFITSPYIVQDLPFGQKELKLSSGEILHTPNVVRVSVNERIISQYVHYCEESGLTPLSRSTLRRILSACTASVRKRLQGLDSFAADGNKAFDDILCILEKLVDVGVDSDHVKRLKTKLKEGRNYLKGDYKVHITSSSQVPDHCSQFALSDSSEVSFKVECSHTHDMCCDRCDSLKGVLADIESTVTQTDFPSQTDKQDAVFACREATACIQTWKSHLLRMVNQDRARTDIIESLEEDSVLLIQDWAMKFLPRQYRESQGEWFAKRGLSWHITVALRRKDNSLETQAYVHVVDECSQDSQCVVALIVHILRTIRHENPEITRAFYRSDNAGCYHSVNTILALPIISKRAGVKVERMDFSDPQGGKGPCDRLAATLKYHVRAYVNEGHDVCSVQELKDALLSHGGLPGVRVALLTNPHASKLDTKIPGISKLNNFSFIEDGSVRVWRAYGVGEGKVITLSQQEGFQVLNTSTQEGRFSDGGFKPLKTKKSSSSVTSSCEASTGLEEGTNVSSDIEGLDEVVHKEDDRASDGEAVGESPPRLFACPNEGCSRSYQRYSSMVNHITYEKCKYIEERDTLLDKAKMGYSDRLMVGQGTTNIGGIESSNSQQSSSRCTDSLSSEEGWALRKKKKAKQYTEKQKAFLEEKFLIGETSKKLDPATVSNQMRLARDDEGHRLFCAEEVLTAAQIQGYFSRRARSSNQEEEDFQAAQIEDAMTAIRNNVIIETMPNHPIECDGYNICQLVAQGRLSKLIIAVLKDFCHHFQLEVEGNQDTRRKAPFIAALEGMIKACSCMTA